jgi:hypothetical protein
MNILWMERPKGNPLDGAAKLQLLRDSLDLAAIVILKVL